MGLPLGAGRQISVWPHLGVSWAEKGVRVLVAGEQGDGVRGAGCSPDLGTSVLCDFSHKVSPPWTSWCQHRQHQHAGNCLIIMLNCHVVWMWDLMEVRDEVPERLLQSTAYIICAVIRDNL